VGDRVRCLRSGFEAGVGERDTIMAVLYWDINAIRRYQLLAIQKNIKPVIEKKMKMKLEYEDIQDRYQLGQVLDIINFEVKTFSTAMQFTLSASFSEIMITVGIEAHNLVHKQNLVVQMF